MIPHYSLEAVGSSNFLSSSAVMTSEFDFYNSFTFNNLWLSLVTELRTQLLDRKGLC